MESFITSELMNGSLLDYWHTDHNPLHSLPLVSTSVCQTHLSPPSTSHVDNTINHHFLDKDGQSKVAHINEDIDSPFIHEWKKPSPNGNDVEFSDNALSQAWFENENDKTQKLDTLCVSTEDICLHSNYLSPSKVNETELFDSLTKDSEKFLNHEILTSCDLYSPLKESSDFNDDDSECLIPPNEISENQRASDHLTNILEAECQDVWQSTDLLEAKHELPSAASNNADQSESNTVLSEKPFPVSKTTLYSVLNKSHAQGLPPRTNNQHIGSFTPLGWLHHSAQFPVKNHIRFRKSRIRKPLLRNFQSSFFRLPIQAKNKSPQLQMVKLFRSNTTTFKPNKESPVQEKGFSFTNKCTPALLKSSKDQSAEENPELAFMKTVDMPSGKRVEDIYVVPSVWISSEESDGSITTNSQLDCTSNMYTHNPNLLVSSLADDSPCQRVNYSSSNILNSFQNENFSSHTIISPVHSPPCNINSMGTKSSSPTEVIWPEEGSNNGLKNLIITTLNAPKIDMVPCLKDLCKAVLNDHGLSLDEQVTQSTSLPTLDMKRLSSESSISIVSQVDQSVYQIKDNKDQAIENLQCNYNVDTHSTELVHLNLDKENIQPRHNPDPDDSLSCEDVPKNDDMTDSPHSVQHYNLKIVNFHGTKGQDTDNSFLDTTTRSSYNQNNIPSVLANTPRTNSLASIGTAHNEKVSQKVAFSTALSMMSASTSCESVHSSYDINDGAGSHTVSSLPEPSSSSSFIDSPFNGELDEDEITSTPELITLVKQIKELHVNDPINKPLANLSTTLHLLYDAEKTLCNANFGVYQQLKMGHQSKFGRLIRCILSLTNTIILMGKTLYEWTRSSTDHQCLKTVEVLSNLYHTNIINLIELITPYFHYVCSLIASCHSDILRLNKARTSLETDQDRSQSSHKICQQSMSDNTLTEKKDYRCMPTPTLSNDLHIMYDSNRTDVINLGQNIATYSNIRSGYEQAKLYTNAAQFSHKRSPSEGLMTSSYPGEKKQKLSLLTSRLPITCKASHFMRATDARMTPPDKVRSSSVHPEAPRTKTLLINITPNRVSNISTGNSGNSRPLALSQTNVRPPFVSQNKPFHQGRTTASTCHNQMPCVLSFRAPVQFGNKDQLKLTRPRNSEKIIGHDCLLPSSISSGNKASE